MDKTEELAVILNHLTVPELKILCKARLLSTHKHNKTALITCLVQSHLTLSELPIEYIRTIAAKMNISNTTDKRDTIVAIEEQTRFSYPKKSKPKTEAERPTINIRQCSLAEGRKYYNDYLQENNLVDKKALDKEWNGYDPFLLHREEESDE